MAKRKPEKSSAQSTVQNLVRYEKNEWPDIKEAVKERNEMRAAVRSLLEQKTELPLNSPVFAGLKITNGRVCYREAFEEACEQYDIPKAEAQRILEKHRKPGRRLKYNENDGQLKLWPEDYEFVTPKSVLAKD